ncbi:AAA family ATPase [Solirubrobacter phytolaccae]|uniref:AAA family ATPase n=1 Tax=Solirubrobacter phytolaccae TaxID=1404360 RepID=A0A9X3NL83_9ACTN|nr:AAA family ATPase [Solirubrobacter phytolaccae]MDA0185636.1 AAA family ATPase [Solirubrobacter phytolaccae]
MATGGGLLGRRAELAAIDAALGQRAGGVLAFSGEGGIGKTRLLDELAARASEALVLSGRASEWERELPFGVWEDALSDHAAFLGVDRLERLVGEQLGELAAVLPLVGRVPAGLQDERYRTHRAVRALLEALALQRPVVLVLDDLQWADDASLELVAALLRRAPRGRVLLALAFRPAPVRPLLATALATAERDGRVIEHALPTLSFADAETLLGADIPAVVRGEIYEAGGGNPFFLQQLARQVAAGRSVASGPGEAGVPQAVSRALEQEIAALSEAGRALAQGAAVAGDPVDLDLAIAAAGLDESRGDSVPAGTASAPSPPSADDRDAAPALAAADLSPPFAAPAQVEAVALGALDELLAGALLVATDVPRRYRFRHPLVRNAIYASAPDGWRIGAHGRAAAALEARGGSVAARAHHLERCARPGDVAAVAVTSGSQ